MTVLREMSDPDLLTPAEEDALLRGVPWRRFVAVGDSTVEGLGDSVDGYTDLPWVGRIAHALRRQRPSLAFLNLGRRHLLTADVRETQLRPALEFGPDLALILCGGNDLMAPGLDPARLEAEIDSIAAPLADAGARLVLTSLFDITAAVEVPEPHGVRLHRSLGLFRDVVAAIAERHDAVFVDFLAHPRKADPTIYSSDMIHLNMRGHAIAASETVRALGRSASARGGGPRSPRGSRGSTWRSRTP
jgi:lysophospholipase L1-like esterase